MSSSIKNICSFISVIKNSFYGSEIVYTHGSCYQFFLILKQVFPSAKAYYNNNHVITKIGTKYYDINGTVYNIKGYLPIEAWGNKIVKQQSKQKFKFNFNSHNRN